MGIKAAIKRISDLNQLLLEEVTGNEVMPLNVSGDRSISINVMQAYIFGNLSATATTVAESASEAQESATAAESARHAAEEKAAVAEKQELRDLVASFLSALKPKPNYRPYIDDQVNDRVYSRFGNFPAGLVGGSEGEIVMGNVKNHKGSYLSADPYLMFFVPSGSEVVHDVSVDISEINSASLSNATVKIVGFASLAGTIADISTLSESDGNYSGSYTNADTYDFVGLQIEFTPSSYTAGEKIGISNISFTSDGVEQIPNDVENSLIQSIVANLNINSTGYVTQRTRTWNAAHYGVYTGKMPRAVFADPAGKNIPGDFSFEYSGDSVSDRLTYRAANAVQRVMAGNGMEAPAVILAAGDYPISGKAGIYLDDGSIIRKAIYACIDGEARFLANSTNFGAIRCGTDRTATGRLELILKNITTDDQHDRPTIFQTCDVYALGCKVNGAGSGRECWELLTCNYFLQECEARDAGNDGFNSHDYLGGGSYGVLVDCISENNVDDGFSPHERTNYEVWGGKFQNNGKGNIIPAFGARGFCFGVYSSGATGLSSRVDPINWGGFVALSAETNDEQTVMWCVECTSDDDTYGFNSSGDLSYVYMVNCTSENQNGAGLRNSSWSGGQQGGPGYIQHIGSTFSDNLNDVVLEDVSRYLTADYGLSSVRPDEEAL